MTTKTVLKRRIRELTHITNGLRATDGDGVKMTRLIGHHQLEMLDPFLLLDCFETEQAQDYIGGFPSHPHRGFETVTYMIDGKMRHKDSMGNEGVIEANGVQWMTAGRGIIHSEMPEQTEGLMRGFQLWVNLPQANKMTAPRYQEFAADKIAVESLTHGSKVRVIAGSTNNGTQGTVTEHFVSPTYFDVSLNADDHFSHRLNAEHNAFIYILEGEAILGEQQQRIGRNQLGILSLGEQVDIQSQSGTCRFLLIAGQPLNESVARAGPFVMNTKQELLQAYSDYQGNRF